MREKLKGILRQATPRMLRSDSPNRPMVVRRRHWLLQETRFLFLTRKGPVEIIVKPGMIIGAAFVGLVGSAVIAAATLFVGLKSVEVVRNESITPAEASAPANLIDDTRTQTLATQAAPNHDPKPVELAAITSTAVRWPPSLAASDAAPIISLPPPKDTEDQLLATSANLAEPDMMMPVLEFSDVADADSTQQQDELGAEPDQTDMGMLGNLKGIFGLDDQDTATPHASGPSAGSSAGPSIEEEPAQLAAVSMLAQAPTVPQVAAPEAPLPPDGGLEPDASAGDLPTLTQAGRQLKVLRSMAKEIRNIRTSLAGLGIDQSEMPMLDDLESLVQTSDFASLAMAVEGHRSMLRKVPLKPPMLYFYISSEYGNRKHPVLKKTTFHHGIDLAGTWQETVHATAPGTVIYAGRKGSFGNVVQIRHAYGIITTYAHLAKITIRKGADVGVGTVIGKMGRTGRVKGAHLHYEIRIGTDSLNPRDFFAIGHQIGVGGELLRAAD